MTTEEILNYYYRVFDEKQFIDNDPICIPHKFQDKEDIEISGFLAATIAWGNRKAIINSALDIIKRMDNAPYDFIINADKNDIEKLAGFYYRTFQEVDLVCFINSLHNIYTNHGGLEKVFTDGYQSCSEDKIKNAIINFRKIFFQNDYPQRVAKHVANPEKGAAAKRINMFLRWMVRNDNSGVDFGLWKNISACDLIIPLDVHVGNVARNLNLINSNSNNWKAAEELTKKLQLLDKEDPVKYDFALFGIGNSKISIDNN
ncbi:MAG: TIGR02757 family protein [Bacteroidales bacterium]|nr:TIGR02757 family protein [Bacteroidales bacterium]MDD3151672.1 TIGR02757 family protein [Bacteroidales bacterium]MDD3914677.1 TIGR02757 family protein [Bacteroidales bacterium]MDD4633398.1 TIGR02757 family protein [Bacteroidales bacterium]